MSAARNLAADTAKPARIVTALGDRVRLRGNPPGVKVQFIPSDIVDLRTSMAAGPLTYVRNEDRPMCHVLIIEDEPFSAMILQDLLEEEGATSVTIAVSEEEAIAAALACRPAVITSDVRLVEGTGPRAVRKIHEMLGDVPVIFITGTPEDCEPCAPPGRVLSKPVDHRAVVAAFREFRPA